MTGYESFRRALIVVGIFGALAVALGALGAHALRGQVELGVMSEKNLSGFETAVRYHMYHALAMFVVVLLRMHFQHPALKFAFRFFLIGIVFFSGSLYLICTREMSGAEWTRALGPVTPVGGLFLVAGWLSLCIPAIIKR